MTQCVGRMVARAICVFAMSFFLAGCGTHGSLESNFKDAPSAVKQKLGKAIDLDKSNDYIEAAAAYDALLRSGLSDEQSQAVREAISALYDRLCLEATKGNPAAKKLLADLNQNLRDSNY